MTGTDFTNLERGDGDPGSTAAWKGERRGHPSALAGVRSRSGRPHLLFLGPCPHPAAGMALAAQSTGRSQEPTIPAGFAGISLPVCPPCQAVSRFWPPQERRPLGEGSSGQIRPETPPSRLSTAEGPAGPGQLGVCATPLPVFPSCRTASWFWPSQGHHPRSGRRQSGQNRPRTPPGRPSAAEGPAGSGQPATCSPARLPALLGGKPIPAGLEALSPLGQATPSPKWP